MTYQRIAYICIVVLQASLAALEQKGLIGGASWVGLAGIVVAGLLQVLEPKSVPPTPPST